MSKKVSVTICGRRYNLLPEDDTIRLEEISAALDREMSEAMLKQRVTPMDAAVLVALNCKEAACQQEIRMDALRTQIQELVEENRRLRQDLADTRREITRAKNGKKTGK